MSVWLIFLLLNFGFCKKTLVFKSSTDGSIAHEVLKTSTLLPEIFRICSSYKENTIEDRSFFTIYGESMEPWLTLSKWVEIDKIRLWLRVNEVWLRVKVIPPDWLNSWTHVCIDLDTNSGNISVSANGEPPVSLMSPEVLHERPKNLHGKILLGLSEERSKQQFQGKIANFNIFSLNHTTLPIQNMTANVCNYFGDIVNFNLQWESVGLVEQVDTPTSEVCNSNTSYMVSVPVKMHWDEGMKLCDKLGRMKEARTEVDLERIISLFKNKNSSCDRIWMPITDEEAEGQFKSSITGKLSTYLPWRKGQPDGGAEENYVGIDVAEKAYWDTNKNYAACVACDAYKTTVFSLIGVCENSYFGKYFLIQFDFYI